MTNTLKASLPALAIMREFTDHVLVNLEMEIDETVLPEMIREWIIAAGMDPASPSENDQLIFDGAQMLILGTALRRISNILGEWADDNLATARGILHP